MLSPAFSAGHLQWIKTKENAVISYFFYPSISSVIGNSLWPARVAAVFWMSPNDWGIGHYLCGRGSGRGGGAIKLLTPVNFFVKTFSPPSLAPLW